MIIKNIHCGQINDRMEIARKKTNNQKEGVKKWNRDGKYLRSNNKKVATK